MRGMSKTPRLMPRSFAHLSDEAVIAMLARSDESALAELYDRFGRVAYGLALRILRDERLAEDAVQEGFLAAWRNADRFIPERGKASTWLLTLVHRRAVDLVRREDRRRAEPLTDGVDAPSSGSAEDDAWLRFERERVQSALKQLPDQQREALAHPRAGEVRTPQRRAAAPSLAAARHRGSRGGGLCCDRPRALGFLALGQARPH